MILVKFLSVCKEIVVNLVTHVGSGFAAEIHASLDVLCSLAKADIDKMAPLTIFVKASLFLI